MEPLIENYANVLKEWYLILSGQHIAYLKNPSIPLQKIAVTLQHTTLLDNSCFLQIKLLYFAFCFLKLQ